MANLIITIISIALVAVAALMAAWYGGSAFQEAQAKSKAAAAINDLKQLAAAVQVYALNRNGSATFPSGTWITAAGLHLVPQYMSQLPAASFYEATNQVYLPTINKLAGTLGTSTTTVSVNTVGLQLKQELGELNICTKFVEILGESAAYLPRPQSTGYAYNFTGIDFSKVQWICTFRDRDNSGGMSDGDGNTILFYIFS